MSRDYSEYTKDPKFISEQIMPKVARINGLLKIELTCTEAKEDGSLSLLRGSYLDLQTLQLHASQHQLKLYITRNNVDHGLQTYVHSTQWEKLAASSSDHAKDTRYHLCATLAEKFSTTEIYLLDRFNEARKPDGYVLECNTKDADAIEAYLKTEEILCKRVSAHTSERAQFQFAYNLYNKLAASSLKPKPAETTPAVQAGLFGQAAHLTLKIKNDTENSAVKNDDAEMSLVIKLHPTQGSVNN